MAVIKHNGQPFQLLKDRKPKSHKPMLVLTNDDEVKDVMSIDTGFGFDFINQSKNIHLFEDDIKGWWYK
jgi:hypothetical protein